MKELIWVIDSLKKLREFPEDVRRAMGQALRFAQAGELAPTAKPLKGFDGVFEIVDDSRSGTYRVVYAAKIGNKLYVLHAFQKKSKSGIATPKKEIDLIKDRLKRAKEIHKNRG